MNSLDIVFLIVGLVFLGLGLSHGFIKSVSSLIAIIAGLFCAKKLEPFISKVLAAVHIHNPQGILGYIFVFFCIFIAVKIILLLIQKVARASGLSPVDRAFGGLLGLIKGVVVIAIIATLMQVALPDNSAVLRNSKLLPYSNKVVSHARAVLPGAIYEHVVKGKPLGITSKIKEQVAPSKDEKPGRKTPAKKSQDAAHPAK